MKKVAELYKKHEEIINYLIVGVLTTVVSVGVKWGLLFTVLSASNPTQLQIAIIISWICAVLFAYVTNRIFVFKSKNKNILKEMVGFFGSRVLTLLIEAFIMWFFITFLKLDTNMWVLIWTMVTQVIVTVLNYVFSKLLVFNKQKNKVETPLILKKLFMGIGLMCGTILLGFVLMLITYAIPSGRVIKNIEQSIDCFPAETHYPQIIPDYSSTQLDNYTDALILNELYYTNSNQTVVTKALRVYSRLTETSPVKSLHRSVNHTNHVKPMAYERYWHGNLFVIKILMLFMDYRAIRFLNMFAITLLLYFICKWMKKRKIDKFIIPFLLSILFINPLVISLSFQFCAVFYMMLISVLCMLKYKEKFDSKNLYPYYFLFVGMVTSFFDFLTYPLVTLGTLLAFYVVLYNKKQGVKEYIIDIIKKIIFYSLLWGIGYGIMWSSKWVISSVILHENLIKDAIVQILHRTETVEYTRLGAIEANIKVFNRPAYYYLILMIVLYNIIRFIRIRNSINWNRIVTIIPYIIIAIMPFCWYYVLSNHSSMHYWFTYRSLILCIMSGLFFIEELFENKKIEVEK